MKPTAMFKPFSQIAVWGVFLFFAQMLSAQTAAPALPDTSKMTYNQISQSMQLYVYPSKGQSKQQQKQDEFECYKWAVEQSGIDPLNLPKVEAPAPQTGPTGGAVVGAAIGAITGDAGEGAAVGAVVGAMGGRRAGKQAQAQQNQQAKAGAEAKEKEMKDSFKKAFTVCIEGKGYTIK